MDKFYIVFSPEGETPPKVMHSSHKKACGIAWMMAKTHPGQTFHVMSTSGKPARVEAESPAETEAEAA